MSYKLTTRPVAEIRWGMMSASSQAEIQDWLIENVRRFLLTEINLPISNLVNCNKDLEKFCKEIYEEIHQVGYEEGYESAQCDNEGEGI